MSNPQVASGSGIYLSAGLPATYDVSGFEALTYTALGEITNAGDLPVKSNISTYLRVSDGEEVKLKGSTSFGETNFEMTLISSDAGQTLGKTARASRNKHSVKVVLGNGEVRYRTALVTSFDIKVGGADDVVSASMGVSWTGDTVEDI